HPVRVAPEAADHRRKEQNLARLLGTPLTVSCRHLLTFSHFARAIDRSCQNLEPARCRSRHGRREQRLSVKARRGEKEQQEDAHVFHNIMALIRRGWQFGPMRPFLIGGSALAIVASVAQAQLGPQQQALHDIYKQLIETNTEDSAGVGNATVATQALADRFKAAGFPESDIHLLGPTPDKQSLVVRLHGTGARKPLLLLAHVDVVIARPTDWDTDPFQLVEKDGYYQARGSIDDKAMAAIFAQTMLRYKQEGFVPDRDLILALTPDEEKGGRLGAGWLMENHRELIGDAVLALNEGGGGTLRDGKPFYNDVQATEKVVTNFTLTAKNPGGHSSLPRPDNAIYELAAGLTRLAHYSFPVMLNDVTRAYFEKTAAIEAPAIGSAMRAILKDPSDAKAAATLSKDPRYNSVLRTTCVATRLSGGHADNALPQIATAF